MTIEHKFEFVKKDLVYPQCNNCLHYMSNISCHAFPAIIPKPLLINEIIHDKPYPGDGGIQFEPKTE